MLRILISQSIATLFDCPDFDLVFAFDSSATPLGFQWKAMNLGPSPFLPAMSCLEQSMESLFLVYFLVGDSQQSDVVSRFCPNGSLTPSLHLSRPGDKNVGFSLMWRGCDPNIRPGQDAARADAFNSIRSPLSVPARPCRSQSDKHRHHQRCVDHFGRR